MDRRGEKEEDSTAAAASAARRVVGSFGVADVVVGVVGVAVDRREAVDASAALLVASSPRPLAAAAHVSAVA